MPDISADNLHAYRQARLSRDPRFDGKFYVAVKTTGIFCRPICPARLPAEKNVTYFLYPGQALMQGFRPCLRCRPDSAPDSYAWLGTTTTVRRAQRLLSAIPPAPVSDIAARLGVSERYLHKLFRQQVGIAPKRYQSVQQVLFAKRLLQESALSVTDVAVASGYHSARQLQRQLQQHCRLSPTDLRNNTHARAMKTDHAAGPVLSLFLPYRPPYNWEQVRAFLTQRAIAGIETVTDTGYQRQFRLGDSSGTVTATHQDARHGFAVSMSLTSLSDIHHVLSHLTRVLDCHADPLLIDQALSAAGLTHDYYPRGIRVPGVWDRFEGGCRAILGQQVSVKAAINKVTQLCETLDERTPFGRCFPTAETVAADNLSWLAMPGRRRDALRRFAELCANQSSPDYDAILAIPGIGPWTTNYMRLRAEHDPDIYLEGDLIVKRAADTLNVDPEQARPWRSYLTAALWYAYGEMDKKQE
ncbi:DNA-3-methyladenine glycosylase 2 family protein [Alteromonas sp. CYL-A6]|uniref:DNA-3-methyladenine glycosylase 2 family protein n=1 Tax=Alteromonas nitratireducens TaxID=3390813 RepID=UPI0034B9743B